MLLHLFWIRIFKIIEKVELFACGDGNKRNHSGLRFDFEVFSCTLGYRQIRTKQIDKRLTGEVFCGTLINIGIGTKGTSDVEM